MRPNPVATIPLCLGLVLALPARSQDDGLEAFLKSYLKPDVGFRVARADLNGDGRPEAVVHITSPEHCGSGGCNTLVLQRVEDGYRIVMEASVTRLPIRALQSRHNGWRDLSVRVQGGGIIGNYEAAMAFNGRRYPSNPTVPPARRVDAPPGEVLIAPD